MTEVEQCDSHMQSTLASSSSATLVNSSTWRSPHSAISTSRLSDSSSSWLRAPTVLASLLNSCTLLWPHYPLRTIRYPIPDVNCQCLPVVGLFHLPQRDVHALVPTAARSIVALLQRALNFPSVPQNQTRTFLRLVIQVTTCMIQKIQSKINVTFQVKPQKPDQEGSNAC